MEIIPNASKSPKNLQTKKIILIIAVCVVALAAILFFQGNSMTNGPLPLNKAADTNPNIFDNNPDIVKASTHTMSEVFTPNFPTTLVGVEPLANARVSMIGLDAGTATSLEYYSTNDPTKVLGLYKDAMSKSNWKIEEFSVSPEFILKSKGPDGEAVLSAVAASWGSEVKLTYTQNK